MRIYKRPYFSIIGAKKCSEIAGSKGEPIFQVGIAAKKEGRPNFIQNPGGTKHFYTSMTSHGTTETNRPSFSCACNSKLWAVALSVTHCEHHWLAVSSSFLAYAFSSCYMLPLIYIFVLLVMTYWSYYLGNNVMVQSTI